jgi:hypothetical protein
VICILYYVRASPLDLSSGLTLFVARAHTPTLKGDRGNPLLYSTGFCLIARYIHTHHIHSVYRRRGHVAIPEGLPQRIPKRMHFVIDCSGSMYRFNSNDKRLDRMIDTVLLVIESLRGFETKFEYSLVGHSGDQCDILLADYGQPPSTTGEKLKILQTLGVCCVSIRHVQADDHTVSLLSLTHSCY